MSTTTAISQNSPKQSTRSIIVQPPQREEEEQDASYLCSVCETHGDLVQCNGHCRRYFHMDCVTRTSSLQEVVYKNKNHWTCSNCVSNLSRCSICHACEHNDSTHALQCCDFPTCFHSFHRTCAEKLITLAGLDQNAPTTISTMMTQCPVHHSSGSMIHCATCGIALPSRTTFMSRRISCFRCLRCFCFRCCDPRQESLPSEIQPGLAKFFMWLNSTTILCDQHLGSPSKGVFSFVREEGTSEDESTSSLEDEDSGEEEDETSTHVQAFEARDRWIFNLEHIEAEATIEDDVSDVDLDDSEERQTKDVVEKRKTRNIKSVLKKTYAISGQTVTKRNISSRSRWSPVVRSGIPRWSVPQVEAMRQRKDLDPRTTLRSSLQFQKYIHKQNLFHKRTYRDILRRMDDLRTTPETNVSIVKNKSSRLEDKRLSKAETRASTTRMMNIEAEEDKKKETHVDLKQSFQTYLCALQKAIHEPKVVPSAASGFPKDPRVMKSTSMRTVGPENNINIRSTTTSSINHQEKDSRRSSSREDQRLEPQYSRKGRARSRSPPSVVRKSISSNTTSSSSRPASANTTILPREEDPHAHRKQQIPDVDSRSKVESRNPKPRSRRPYPILPELQHAYIDEAFAQRFRIPLNLIRLAWKKSHT